MKVLSDEHINSIVSDRPTQLIILYFTDIKMCNKDVPK